jgi:hypothetical protein
MTSMIHLNSGEFVLRLLILHRTGSTGYLLSKSRRVCLELSRVRHGLGICKILKIKFGLRETALEVTSANGSDIFTTILRNLSALSIQLNYEPKSMGSSNKGQRMAKASKENRNIYMENPMYDTKIPGLAAVLPIYFCNSAAFADFYG